MTCTKNESWALSFKLSRNADNGHTSGFKGDTASGGGKPATTETGLVITVPFFVENGEIVLVDTRTGELERAKK